MCDSAAAFYRLHLQQLKVAPVVSALTADRSTAAAAWSCNRIHLVQRSSFGVPLKHGTAVVWGRNTGGHCRQNTGGHISPAALSLTGVATRKCIRCCMTVLVGL